MDMHEHWQTDEQHLIALVERLKHARLQHSGAHVCEVRYWARLIVDLEHEIKEIEARLHVEGVQ